MWFTGFERLFGKRNTNQNDQCKDKVFHKVDLDGLHKNTTFH